jgi:hypothetical protein
MSIYEVNGDASVATASNTSPVADDSGGRGLLSLKVDGENFEFCYRPASAPYPLQSRGCLHRCLRLWRAECLIPH